MLAKQLKVDTSRPGFLKLRRQDIEWVTGGISFDPTHQKRPGRTLATVHTASCSAIRRSGWSRRSTGWRSSVSGDSNSKRSASGAAHTTRSQGEFKKLMGPSPCVFLPDDRTIVFDEEDGIRKIAGGEDPAPPAYLRGPDWERASRGLLAVAIKNQDGTFAKHYDLGRPDDAVVLSLFKGVDWWIFGVDDADSIVLHADATCRDRDASEAVSRSLDSLIKLGRQTIEHDLAQVA